MGVWFCYLVALSVFTREFGVIKKLWGHHFQLSRVPLDHLTDNEIYFAFQFAVCFELGSFV